MLHVYPCQRKQSEREFEQKLARAFWSSHDLCSINAGKSFSADRRERRESKTPNSLCVKLAAPGKGHNTPQCQSLHPITPPSLLGRCRERARTHRRWRRRRARWPPPPRPRSLLPPRSRVVSASDAAGRPRQGGAPAGGACVRRRPPGGRSCSRRGACRTRGARRRASIRTLARYAIKNAILPLRIRLFASAIPLFFSPFDLPVVLAAISRCTLRVYVARG
jgi:hypothetical protein